MGGGGGSTQATETDVNKAKKQLGTYYNFQQNQENQYVNKSPLLSRAETGATGFWDQIQGLLGPMQGLLGPMQGLLGPMQQSFAALPGAAGISGLESSYGANVAPVIASGGALTGEGLRTSQQQARAASGAAGTSHDISAVVNEALNNEANRTNRYNTALGQAGTLRGLEGQITGNQGQSSGLLQGLTSGIQGLTSGIQGLQTGGLNQLLGVEGGEVSDFTTLNNPVLGFLSNILQSNANVRIANAQTSAQQQAQSKAGGSSAIGGILSAVGSIAPMLAMSDERIKTKIKKTGKDIGGVPEKSFEYKTDPEHKRYTGFMAGDVEKVFPWNVLTDPVSGLKLVTGEFVPKEI